ncbi:hypothetical protein P152DRAFT_426905 [Eremomyces bilateralis CBS 781.70]|uniref:Rhodopsin domain-containing protein n=1 Tax=Eremomyces bilateralis CBS 781.70 TaxID=1392243 RepID=A0A6G1GGJ7_9PEZI|nr:uncharacterized protein P152DRAFT_426905 [Eremomyces bilateralis CBS 781.70]KAF1817227.1 hypothetical protein P152DRAFT_426905 [Eremomyces bilateralis CBS 781.70]
MAIPRFLLEDLPSNISQGPKLISLFSVFYAIALIAVLSRLWIRFRMVRFGLDDWFILAAMACATGLYIIAMVGIANGLGRHIHYLTPDEIVFNARTSIFVTEFYVWGVTMAKISLLIMLFRLVGEHKRWKQGIVISIAIMVVLAVASSLWNYLQCRPLKALWDLSISRDACINKKYWRDPGTFMVSDILLSLLPIFVIGKIQRSRGERAVICLLMALGLLCSAAIVPKLITLQHYGMSLDFTWFSAELLTWSMVELLLGITTTCMPTLKSVGEKYMRKLGLLATKGGAQH